MVKATTSNKDVHRRSLILGLSDENIKRLQEGQPIKFNLSALYPGVLEGDCFILYDKTETDIVKSLDGAIPKAPKS